MPGELYIASLYRRSSAGARLHLPVKRIGRPDMSGVARTRRFIHERRRLRILPLGLEVAGVDGSASTGRSMVARGLEKLGARPVSAAEDMLAFQLDALRVPYKREWRIHPKRRFRADFWLPGHKIVLEVEGGGFVNGRHSRGVGIESDAEKSFYIATMPARLIRLTPKQIKDGRAASWIEACIREAA